ncbi:hypothetical protein SCOCK_50238 [Actinacidiphila cocklensis]|uniref:Uncharacterized protein n=1 Tax=Actinacidiphila cocklensis TaxID=887465 RepID=A0A9W4E0E7_9ACTN|nr:hypothetical protein SCOCK_50238 [Actinacidiphila cocklensis]
MIALSETTRTTGAFERLSDEGISIWLDGLSRKRSGAANLAERAGRRHVVGVTTTPSTFQVATAQGDGCAPHLAESALATTEHKQPPTERD